MTLLKAVFSSLMVSSDPSETSSESNASLEKATFAGGCFWCMEHPFKELDGVLSVISGYTGGISENPTYEEVCSGESGHYEAVQITYDPKKTSYQQLLDIFWRQIDPTDGNGQFVDRGSQYKSAIFYHSPKQQEQAEKSRAAVDDSKRFALPVATEILEAETFFPAEDYHQGYYKTNPVRYQQYRFHSGRDDFLNRT